MKEIVYLTKEELLQYYRETIQQSGGGMADIRDEGGLDKVLVFIQDDDYYPTFEDKLTYLVFGLCHCTTIREILVRKLDTYIRSNWMSVSIMVLSFTVLVMMSVVATLLTNLQKMIMSMYLP